VGAHPCAALGDLAQQRVEIDAITSLVNGIDPDQNAIDFGQLGACRLDYIVLVDDLLGVNPGLIERCEDCLEPAVFWGGGAAVLL
jgi:hypothetical protein